MLFTFCFWTAAVFGGLSLAGWVADRPLGKEYDRDEA